MWAGNSVACCCSLHNSPDGSRPGIKHATTEHTKQTHSIATNSAAERRMREKSSHAPATPHEEGVDAKRANSIALRGCAARKQVTGDRLCYCDRRQKAIRSTETWKPGISHRMPGNPRNFGVEGQPSPQPRRSHLPFVDRGPVTDKQRRRKDSNCPRESRTAMKVSAQ